jgi:hypothetical protein
VCRVDGASDDDDDLDGGEEGDEPDADDAAAVTTTSSTTGDDDDDDDDEDIKKKQQQRGKKGLKRKNKLVVTDARVASEGMPVRRRHATPTSTSMPASPAPAAPSSPITPWARTRNPRRDSMGVEHDEPHSPVIGRARAVAVVVDEPPRPSTPVRLSCIACACVCLNRVNADGRAHAY